jgi:hypothetical protein
MFGLAGCANRDFFGETPADTPPPASNVQAIVPPPAPAPLSVGATAPEATSSQAALTAAPAISASEPPAVTAARYAAPPSAAVSYHCKNLARLRAGDVAFQGEDPDTQKAVYDGTYRDCVAWDAAHRS